MNFRYAIISFGVLGLVVTANASLIELTNRAAVNQMDSIDWGQLGGPGSGVASHFSGVTGMGDAFNLDGPANGMLAEQQGYFLGDYSGGWDGNFAGGDNVVWSAQNPGSMTLTLGQSQMAAGAQLQSDTFGDFTATVSAYDQFNNLLGTFTEGGTSNGNADNTAIFLGVRSSADNIHKLVFDVTDAYGNEDFAMNQVSLSTCGAVPEPSTIVAMTVGAAALLRRRRK